MYFAGPKSGRRGTMRAMSKILSLVFALSLGLAACGGSAKKEAATPASGAGNPCATNPCGTGDNPCANPCGDNPCGDNPCATDDGDSAPDEGAGAVDDM